MSTTVDLGKISLTPMDEYTHGTQYEKLDLVTYQRGLFIAKEDNQNILPTVTSTWMKIGDFSEGAVMTDNVNGVGHPDGTTITVDANGTFSATCKVVYVTEVPTVSNATRNTLYIKGSSADGFSIYTLIGNTMENVSKMIPKYAGSSSAGGSATSAVKLQNARTIQTNLASTSSASFDGTANVTPGVTGVLPVANGGTGTDTLSDAYNAFIQSKNYDGNQTIYDEDRLTIEHEEIEGEFNILRTSFACVWKYIKGCIASIFGLSESTLTTKNMEKSLIGSLDTDYTYYTSDNENSCFLPSLEDTGNGRVIKKRPISSIIGLLGSVGNSTRPVYFQYGYPVQCDYTLNKSVPSDAKFTDTVYTHPTSSGNKHIPSGGSSGKLLRWNSNGTAEWSGATNGSATQPIYMNAGVPTACTYSLNKTVPSNAVFTDTNTWRPVQNNLTSTSTSDCLSAYQGNLLNGRVQLLENADTFKLTNNSYIKIKGNVVTFYSYGGASTTSALNSIKLQSQYRPPYPIHIAGYLCKVGYTSRYPAYLSIGSDGVMGVYFMKQFGGDAIYHNNTDYWFDGCGTWLNQTS